MKVRKILWLMTLSIFCLCAFNKGYAQELLTEEEIIESAFEKIYVSTDQILIYPEGIFYLNEAGDVIPVRLISSDGSGLYIVKARTCYACRKPLNPETGLCGNPKCRMFGR